MKKQNNTKKIGLTILAISILTVISLTLLSHLYYHRSLQATIAEIYLKLTVKHYTAEKMETALLERKAEEEKPYVLPAGTEVEGIITFSPWLDLTMENPAIKKYEKVDPWLRLASSLPIARSWANGTPLTDYRISPTFGALEGLDKVSYPGRIRGYRANLSDNGGRIEIRFYNR